METSGVLLDCLSACFFSTPGRSKSPSAKASRPSRARRVSLAACCLLPHKPPQPAAFCVLRAVRAVRRQSSGRYRRIVATTRHGSSLASLPVFASDLLEQSLLPRTRLLTETDSCCHPERTRVRRQRSASLWRAGTISPMSTSGQSLQDPGAWCRSPRSPCPRLDSRWSVWTCAHRTPYSVGTPSCSTKKKSRAASW